MITSQKYIMVYINKAERLEQKVSLQITLIPIRLTLRRMYNHLVAQANRLMRNQLKRGQVKTRQQATNSAKKIEQNSITAPSQQKTEQNSITAHLHCFTYKTNQCKTSSKTVRLQKQQQHALITDMHSR
ncbi:hypothetical protein HYC85_013667 [Camellia sinensis]|uniref:Uncharacterized protein n=1 Tax=Camellia sinensis TaxID=4442 RepID=A0A7J7H401_CAMSI|nr:hypothetical protein HYC85_013667 [Camellia sinensis]